MIYSIVYIIPILHAIYHTWCGIYCSYIPWYITFYGISQYGIYHSCDISWYIPYTFCDITVAYHRWYITHVIWKILCVIYHGISQKWYIPIVIYHTMTGIYQSWLVYHTTQPSRWPQAASGAELRVSSPWHSEFRSESGIAADS